MNESITDPIASRHRARHAGRSPASALVIDPDTDAREFLRYSLSRQCAFVEVAESGSRADQLLDRYDFDLIVVASALPEGSGSNWLARRRDAGDRVPAIILCSRESDVPRTPLPRSDTLAVPFSIEQMENAVSRLLRSTQPEQPVLTAGDDGGTGATGGAAASLDLLVGSSEPMQELARLIERVAARSTTVLLQGESGTGKELAARRIHMCSGRNGAFVPVNCGSITAELLESELFGHVRGAFTGATHQREGLFSYANGGTILLDEICEMPFPMQAKLLRVLEERAIRPVGSEKEQPVDVRIVAATNRDMAHEVAQGRFREDLYYRLNVLALRLPPLRERPSDIPQLVALFSDSLSRQLLLPPVKLNRTDFARLQQYSWPGNVRELKNLVERAILLGCSPADCLETGGPATDQAEARGGNGYPVDLPLADVERLHILEVLKAAAGNKSEAARRLRISRKTLERKLKAWRVGQSETD